MGALPPNYLARSDAATAQQYESYAQAARHAEMQAASQRGLSGKPSASLVVPLDIKPAPRKAQSSRERMRAERKETIEKERRADNLFDIAMLGAVAVLTVLYSLGWLS